MSDLSEPAHADQIRAAVAFHERELAAAVVVWRDGLDVLVRALDPLHGYPDIRPPQATQLALMVAAAQSLACAHDLAMRGHYAQALSLVRSPYEHLIAAMYLTYHPDEHGRFTDPARQPPDLDHMTRRIGAGMRERYGAVISAGWLAKTRRWIDTFLPFSPADRRVLTMPRRIQTNDTGSRGTRLTVQHDQAGGLVRHDHHPPFFNACTERACGVISLLLRQTVILRKRLGYDDLPEVRDYAWRYAQWRKAMRQALRDAENGAAPGEG